MFTIPKGCCNRDHLMPATKFDIGAGALGRCPHTLSDAGLGKHLLLVADQNTWLAAGKEVHTILQHNGYSVNRHVFSNLESAEMETAKQLADLARAVDGILAVGTGTINDLCRYAGFLSKKPYAIVATAASMDGFCSSVAPLIENGFKRTYEAITPNAVIGDAVILDQAPKPLTAAGLADLLGKYTCLADWKISHLLTGEYFCPGIEAMVRQAVDEAVSSVPAIRRGKPGAVVPLMNALCLSGVAMALSGNSRPASGAEHHLSHFWEMRFLQEGRKAVFHGAKVGVATVLIADYYHNLAKIEDIRPWLSTPPVLCEEYLTPAYGSLWKDILHDNTPDPLLAADPERIATHWQEIREMTAKIPSAAEIRRLVSGLGGPISTDELDISSILKFQGFLFGRYVRPRLTLLRISDYFRKAASIS